MRDPLMKLVRLPLESPEPLRLFAALRVGLAACATIGALAFSFAHSGRLALVTGLVALPWSVALAATARRQPAATLTPAVAVVDFAILGLAELASPDAYSAVPFVAIVLIAAHAHVQGEQRGAALALLAVVVLVPISDVNGAPVSGGLLAFYEVLFAVSALAAGLFVGRLRTAESTGRLRARELSRRAIDAENQVRRRVAESIHDGPVQELVSLDMMLESARRAVSRGDARRAQETLEEARRLTERNVEVLREEIIGLGPYAFDELSLDAALEQCLPVRPGTSVSRACASAPRCRAASSRSTRASAARASRRVCRARAPPRFRTGRRPRASRAEAQRHGQARARARPCADTA